MPFHGPVLIIHEISKTFSEPQTKRTPLGCVPLARSTSRLRQDELVTPPQVIAALSPLFVDKESEYEDNKLIGA